jgi:hypothetical protein
MVGASVEKLTFCCAAWGQLITKSDVDHQFCCGAQLLGD